MATIPAPTTTVLPMWRSPTASSCGSRTPSYPLRVQDSWDDDGAAYALGSSAHSPTRIVQCLNFLSQVDRVDVHELKTTRFHDPIFRIDVYLSEDDETRSNSSATTTSIAPQSPTYQIERSLADFEQLRDGIALWTTLDGTGCTYCTRFQTRRVSWGQNWPRHTLRRLFGIAKPSMETRLQGLLTDVLSLSQSQLCFNQPCAALQQVPALLTSFLVRHELSMDE